MNAKNTHFLRGALLIIALFVLGGNAVYAQNTTPFVTTWEVAEGDLGITIPTRSYYTYSYTVDWGDSSADTMTYTGDADHTYSAAGIYTVSIVGTFPSIYFNAYSPINGFGDSTNSRKIKTIKQWGDNPWESMRYAFNGCSNLTIEATAGNPDLSNVTDMSYMFYFNTDFNQDLSGWDVGNVKFMVGMFGATAFNQDLSGWDVSNVVSMQSMFYKATTFNQDLSGWDVSNVRYMFDMFNGATAFNQDLSGWDVSNVTHMSWMFANTTDFNQILNGWDVSNVTSMGGMFHRTTAFNQDLSGWDVSNVTSMGVMFRDTTAFNQDLSGWDVSNVTNMSHMFYYARAFNQDLGGWDVSNVTNMARMFEGATLSTENYDALLRGWSALSLQMDVPFGGGDNKYCDESARNILVDEYNWDITDGEKDTDENCARYQAPFTFASTRLTKGFGDAAFTVTPIGGSGTGGITYLSTDPTVATIVDNTGEVTIEGIGRTTITATKAGDTTYNPVTARYILTIDYGTAFVTTWEVAADDLEITIPIRGGFAYGYTVDWGDSSADTMTYTGDATHAYTTAGIYTVSISGTFPSIYFEYFWF